MCEQGQTARLVISESGASSGADLVGIPLGLPFRPMAVAIDPSSEHHTVVIAPRGRLEEATCIRVGVGAPYIGPELGDQSHLFLPAQSRLAAIDAFAALNFYEFPPNVLPMKRGVAAYRMEGGGSVTTTPAAMLAFDTFNKRKLNGYVPGHGRSEGVFQYRITNPGVGDVLVKLYAVISRPTWANGQGGLYPLTTTSTAQLIATHTVTAAGSPGTGVYNFGGMRADAYYATIEASAGTINNVTATAAFDLYDA